MANPEPLPTTEPTSLSIPGSTGPQSTVTDPAPGEDKETPKKQGTTAPTISSRLTNINWAM